LRRRRWQGRLRDVLNLRAGIRYACVINSNVARNAMAADEEDRPRKKITHEIGQDLALLSVGELNERIALLQQEIERLQAVATSKEASRSAADKFFKS
jgi:uncharacterized small protein (DUF1192 family)